MLERAGTGSGVQLMMLSGKAATEKMRESIVEANARPARENDRRARQVRSSAGIAVFVSAKNDKAHRIESGRCYERFALQATALGIRNAMLNQPVEVASGRPELAHAFGLGDRQPDLVVRSGGGPKMLQSLRRPLPALCE